MAELAWVNGTISPIDQARIPINDRGLVFGDGVYEVIAAYRGTMFLFAEHLRRLRRSLDEIRLEHVEIEPIAKQIEQLYRQSELDDAKVYLQINRGIAPRDHAFPQPLPEPSVIITVRELHRHEEVLMEKGVPCITQEDLRWGRVDIKTINLLPNVLAKQAAVDAGCYETILLAPDDTVREGTSANLFVINDGALYTHPANQRILPGITREFLLNLAAKNGIVCHEEKYKRDFMMQADEVFISGTTTEVMPVVSIDGQAIADGKPGAITQRLLQLFRDWVEAELAGSSSSE